MTNGDEPDISPPQQPEPLNYRAPRDDRAARNAVGELSYAGSIFLGIFVSLTALPAAVVASELALGAGFEFLLASPGLLIICLCWKPMRGFGIGLLIAAGILLPIVVVSVIHLW